MIGTRGALSDGRVFYYAMNTAAPSLPVGQLHVSAAITAGHENITVNAAADLTRGAVTVTLTVTATVVANEYQEGFLCVTDGTGEGFSYRIRNHAGRTGAGTFTAELWDPIIVGAAVATTITLVRNLWRDPVLALTSQVAVPVGVPTATIAAGNSIEQFGWMQTWGLALGLDETTDAVGSAMTASPNTQGRFEIVNGHPEAGVGWQIATGVAAEYQPKFLRIAP